MMLRLRTSSPKGTDQAPPTSTRGAGEGGQQEEAEEEVEWREARRWSVEEAAEMMGVTVRDVARALGLNFERGAGGPDSNNNMQVGQQHNQTPTASLPRPV